MKTFPLQMQDDLHKQVKHAAIDEGKTLHEWIIDAIKRKLEVQVPIESNEVDMPREGTN